MMNTDNLVPFLVGVAVGYVVIPRLMARMGQ